MLFCGSCQTPFLWLREELRSLFMPQTQTWNREPSLRIPTLCDRCEGNVSGGLLARVLQSVSSAMNRNKRRAPWLHPNSEWHGQFQTVVLRAQSFVSRKVFSHLPWTCKPCAPDPLNPYSFHQWRAVQNVLLQHPGELS